MKKLLGIVVLGLLWCTISTAGLLSDEEIKYNLQACKKGQYSSSNNQGISKSVLDRYCVCYVNKIDQNYNPENFLHLQKDSFCYISAKTGYGINSLRKMISEKLFENYELMTVKLTPLQGEIRSLIYQNCNVLEEIFTKSGHNLIKFTAMQGYIKYLAKVGLTDRKEAKTTKNLQEIYKTG